MVVGPGTVVRVVEVMKMVEMEVITEVGPLIQNWVVVVERRLV